MKNNKLTFFAFSVVLLAASCKKNDYKETGSNADSAATSNAADTLGWTASAGWQKADQGTFAVQYFTIQDSSITSEVADNGLVLMFKKNGTDINTMPFEETSSTAAKTASTGTEEATNANYWYHQVAAGSLMVSCDVYKTTATPVAANSFKYFVLTPQKLQDLETAGYTAEKLMNLSYSEASALLKK